ncbi:ABC transporter ATP-binding protein/permease [Neisseriaceae bacterium TC5R-5]|nr:ABC transporter ATP-binding protein/permease [Neisseriaceae bacterium TC5R-5]
MTTLDFAKPQPIPLAHPGQQVWPYLWAAVIASAPWSTASMLLATLVGTFCNVTQSYMLGLITEYAMAARSEQVTELLLVLMTLWLTAPLLQTLQSLARLYSSQNLRIAVTDHLSTRLMYAHTPDIANNAVGNLVERIELASTSLPAVVETLSNTVVKLLAVAVLTSIMLLSVSSQLALLSATWMLSAILLSSYLAYSGMNIVEDASDAHAKAIAGLAEIVTNIPIIRSFSAQQLERRRFGQALQKDLLACRQVRSYWVFVLIIETIYKCLFGISIILYALQQYSSGSLALYQLITVCSLIIALSWHFESVAFHFVDLFDALGVLRASLRELSTIHIDLPTHPEPITLPAPGKIGFRHVNAYYQTTPVLFDINLDIWPGSKVGIVGPSGSGKSSLLALLRGELLASSGTIELHGLPMEQLSPETLATSSSEAIQNALLFNRSIMENLVYGQHDANEQQIGQALDHAQAQVLIQQLPKGLLTEIGERGATLSTGERQRLNIARALLKKAPLLIFDEATSSVDTISESSILQHLISLAECTVIVVTHRVSTLNGFDMVVVMEKGRIVDIGRPEELSMHNSLFQQLQRNDQQERFVNSIT